MTLSVCECYDWEPVVGAVLCSVFLAADEPKSRRNVELQPVFSQCRQELVQSSTAVLSCFTLCITLCVCLCLSSREGERETERVCSDAFVLCQWRGSEMRAILVCFTLWFWMFCPFITLIVLYIFNVYVYIFPPSPFSPSVFQFIVLQHGHRDTVMKCSLSGLSGWDLLYFYTSQPNVFSNAHFMWVHALESVFFHCSVHIFILSLFSSAVLLPFPFSLLYIFCLKGPLCEIYRDLLTEYGRHGI